MNYCTKTVLFFCLLGGLLVAGVRGGTSKRGLAYNENISLEDFGATGSQITWQYNWGSSTSQPADPSREYVPMLWSNYTAANASWGSDARAAIASGSRHLLAFNEPELSSQADLSPAAAAALYRELMEPFAIDGSGARLGAPAVSNDGWAWINEFLGNCTDCTVDFVPVHWYNPWNMTSDLENWVDMICGLPGNRPVWVTELGPSDAATITADQQEAFLRQATTFLDNSACVERYAYFGSADGDESLLANGGPALSTLGQHYAYGEAGVSKETGNSTAEGQAEASREREKKKKKCGQKRGHAHLAEHRHH